KSRPDRDTHALPAGCESLERRLEKTDRTGDCEGKHCFFGKRMCQVASIGYRCRRSGGPASPQKMRVRHVFRVEDRRHSKENSEVESISEIQCIPLLSNQNFC